MKRRFLRWLQQQLQPNLLPTVQHMADRLNELSARNDNGLGDYMERIAELAEARQMAGAGPWTVGPQVLEETDRIIASAKEAWDGKLQHLREATPIGAQGAFGDMELALQNIEWRREVQLSWLEFSRWGIQQIILYTRLHYIKNPIIRRLIDVGAAYVFARGVDVSCSDPDGNDTLRAFFQRNKNVIGQNALVDLERRKDYDGNIFFVLFADEVDTGEVNIRTIDATEINEIVSAPNDADTPQFYKRVWTQRTFDLKTGTPSSDTKTAWYPALGYEPDDDLKTIGPDPVMTNARILHRKCGGVAKWAYGCPRMYPALNYARESTKYLGACASLAQSLSQFGLILTTKGGQQALMGAKQQMGTTVGPSGALWDTNPPAVAGSTFASGPGTTMEAFKTAGAGLDPEKVRRYILMCCMVPGVPETFTGDVSTGNLATASSLDRPTETGFLERQESWREDLVTISSDVLKVAIKAPNSKLREALEGRGVDIAHVRIMEAPRKRLASGRWVYLQESSKRDDTLEVKADFPAIREGDVPALVKATVEAMTLENKGGQVIGIDEKAGVRYLYDLLDFENADELAEDQYPEGEYNPDRTKEVIPPPIQKAKPAPGGEPQAPPADVPGVDNQQNPPPPTDQKIEAALKRLARGLKIWEASKERTNGAPEHTH